MFSNIINIFEIYKDTNTFVFLFNFIRATPGNFLKDKDKTEHNEKDNKITKTNSKDTKVFILFLIF